MTKASHLLGMNAREQVYKILNSSASVKIANSKLLTKEKLKEAAVTVPKLYQVFSDKGQLDEFDFNQINTSFVIKPSGGSGGKGILIIRKPSGSTDKWLGVDGKQFDLRDLKLHIEDILEGTYSAIGSRSNAFVEERIPKHPKFKKLVQRGTPDVRVLVFNRVPIMAMLRLPTPESEGRANLHQGAIGVGIDVGTGVTLTGVKNGESIRYLPSTKRKLNGIKIPKWTSLLTMAVEAMDAIGLVYGGVDLLIDPEKGPMVIELNARPGLNIQLANNTGLRWRLERVEGLKIRNPEHGVRVGKALFAESFADKVRADEGLVIVGIEETVRLKVGKKDYQEVLAQLNTGVYRTQIDKLLADKLGLLEPDNILWRKKVGKSTQLAVGATYFLKGRKKDSAISVVDLNRSKYKLILGRLDLQGFLVDTGYKS